MITSIMASKLNDPLTHEDLEHENILWHGDYLDGKLVFIRTPVQGIIRWYFESFDIRVTGDIALDVDMSLKDLINNSLDTIKSMYLQQVVEQKNEELMHGDSSVH